MACHITGDEQDPPLVKISCAPSVFCLLRRVALTRKSTGRVFLPALMLTVVGVVVFKGGQAGNICYNTVALLFIVDIDNMAYHVGMKESMRARVELYGRVDLTPAQAEMLWYVKRLVMYSMPVALVLPLPFFLQLMNGPGWASVMLPYFGMAVAEECVRARPPPLFVLSVRAHQF